MKRDTILEPVWLRATATKAAFLLLLLNNHFFSQECSYCLCQWLPGGWNYSRHSSLSNRNLWKAGHIESMTEMWNSCNAFFVWCLRRKRESSVIAHGFHQLHLLTRQCANVYDISRNPLPNIGGRGPAWATCLLVPGS